MSTLVSAVITTYKRPDRLRRAMKSVVNQTYKNMEIIVVDGANSPENKAIAEDFHWKTSKKIIYVPVEPEAVECVWWVGVQHARNIGCKKAKGKYIAMLDDDDVWHKEKIKKQVNIFKYGVCGLGQKDIALVACYNRIISGGNEVIDKPKINPTFNTLLKSFNLSSTSTFMIRRDVLKKIGWWNEKLRGMHEYDIALKLTKLGYKIYVIPEVLMTRERISNLKSSYYYIKIAEIMDMWFYYGKDFLSYLGIKGFLFNCIKTFGLFGVYLMGYIVKEKVWDIIYPLKIWYEQKVI